MDFYKKNIMPFHDLKKYLSQRVIITFIVIFAFFFGSISANQIDSDPLQLNNKKIDTNRVWVYNDLAFHQVEDYKDSSLYFNQQALLLASNINLHQEAVLSAEINRRFIGAGLLILLFFALMMMEYRRMIGVIKIQLLEIESIKSKITNNSGSVIDFSAINFNLPTSLTEREMDVIEQLELGLSNQEIAKQLFVSENTIKTHLKNIFIKTEAQSRTDLIHRLKLFSENGISS